MTRKVVNVFTKSTVRIGEQLELPGRMLVEIDSFRDESVVFKRLHGEREMLSLPMVPLGLKWVEGRTRSPLEASAHMTDADWSYAAELMKEVGGGFAQALALAYMRADSENQRPIKEGYRLLFFGYLTVERQRELREA